MALFTPASAEDARVLAEQTRMVHRQAPASLVGGLVVLVLSVAVFRNRAELAVLLSWAAIIIALTVMRWRSWRAVQPELGTDSSMQAWLVRTTVFLLCSGICWGSGLALFFAPDDPLQIAVVVIFCTALLAGAVVPLSAYARCYQIYAIPVAVPTVVLLFISDLVVLEYIAVGLLLFLIVNIGYSKNVENSMIALIEAELENTRLVEDLSAHQDELVMHRNEALKQAQIANDANLARSQFLAVASHDLAQPLHSLGLFLDSLAVETKEARQPAQESLVHKAHQCWSAMTAMFSSLLEVSKLEAGVIEVNRVAIDARVAMEPVLTEFLPKAEAKALSFEVDLESCVFDTDPSVFQRVLRNLLSNGLNHTDHGHIGVRVRPHDDRVQVDVFDTGAGIAQDELGNVFKEHYQIKTPGRGALVGLGLGLSIVEGLSTLLDIELTVESKVGVGTTFSLMVPAAQEASTTLEKQPVNKDINSLKDRLLVAIDDNESSRQAIATVLAREPCQLVIESDVDAAISTLATRNAIPDIIVSDYDLADGRNGLDAIERIRDEFNASIPAIIITGHGAPDLFRQIDERCIPFLLKPFTKAELLTAVSAELNRRGTLSRSDGSDNFSSQEGVMSSTVLRRNSRRCVRS